ncbi:MAG TPA: M14 family zinc carboxypeptidase [Candidatus Cloacimonadota bacterium]|nr:M14 family zinc carboxypeptidase [Candidatus Cloacimonadota bacterium]
MRLAALIILLTAILALGAQNLPTCYYTYAQISQMLTDHEAQHPDIAKKVQIGVTQQEGLPIYAMRISDNVNNDEQEPAILLVGQVHAEEVLGVQITMSNIAEILANRYQLPYNQWINQLDIWLIPSLTPEGHNVVTANLDTSYRKNKRDNNNNGVFDYSNLVGYDIDGVDINRNFSFNWVQGDTLMQPGGLEVWDYYRGPAPMSESEVQAVYNLAEQYRFVYSIVWHSSRTGNLSEKCYYPFNWKEVRPSPDVNQAAAISAGIAAQITKEAGGATYESLPNLSRKGAFHDWMYQQYGTIQILIECGTRNLQPDSLLMVNTVQRCSNGVRWLLNRALPYSSDVPTSAMLTGIVKDSVTNQPLEAEVIIQQHHADWLRPRLSYASNGRYYRSLQTGNYTVIGRKRGYFDTVLPSVTINNTNWTPRDLILTPRQPATLSGHVQSGGIDIPALIVLGNTWVDSLVVNGAYVYQAFEGEYPITIHADGYYPYQGSVTLNPGANHRSFDLSPATVGFSEDWEDGTANWQIEGPWVVQNEQSVSGYAITDSWGGRGFYAQNCDVWIQTVNPISIPASGDPLLSFDSHLYTEHVHDPVKVQISADGTTWTTLWESSGRKDWWQRQYVGLSDYPGSYYLRFRLTDESINIELTDPGWTIDNIRVITGSAVADGQLLNPALPSLALYPNYPNPFNPSTTIAFANSQSTDMKLEIFNLKGQRVRLLVDEQLPAGNHQAVWNGQDDAGRSVASGMYMYRLTGQGYSKTYKMMLLK